MQVLNDLEQGDINSGKLKSFLQFVEEDAAVVASGVPANNTTGIPGTGDDNQTVVVRKRKSPMFKRNQSATPK